MLDPEGHKRKTARNRNFAHAKLTAEGVQFLSRNNGAHLIIERPDFVIDFWPGTGKWIFRESGKQGRGIFNLLKLI